MNSLEKIEEIRKTPGFVFGPFLNKSKRDQNFVNFLKGETKFLDSIYSSIPISQRFYHVFFRSFSPEICSHCESPRKFSAYDRFSPERRKRDANYYPHCGSIGCQIKDFAAKDPSEKGYGGFIGKITKDEGLRNQLLEKTGFLDDHYQEVSDSQRFYHLFFQKYEIEKCECGKPRKFSFLNKFSPVGKNRETNYNGTCGSKECISEISSRNSKKTLIEKYGVGNIWEIPGYREKLEESNIKKYGSPYVTGTNYFREKFKEKIEKDWDGIHPTKHQKVQDKKKETNLERYGMDCILRDRDKMRLGMMKKYGYDHNLKVPEIKKRIFTGIKNIHGGIFHQSKSIKEKSDKTNMERYGEIHIFQSPRGIDRYKNSMKYKDYELPSGKIIRIQGYENLALDILVNKYKEEDIITSQMEIEKIIGKIKYRLDEKDHSYFPDIYIRSENKIIEVKSEYTYNKELIRNTSKKLACLKKNILFEFWIFDEGGNLKLSE
jgi:hypothetical protein